VPSAWMCAPRGRLWQNKEKGSRFQGGYKGSRVADSFQPKAPNSLQSKPLYRINWKRNRSFITKSRKYKITKKTMKNRVGGAEVWRELEVTF
jgi:hypothetical protein